MSAAATPPRRTLAMAATLGGLTLLLALAGWLRWDALRSLSLYVDEFTTLWAARQVQAHGLPIMPSGVLYTRGCLPPTSRRGWRRSLATAIQQDACLPSPLGCSASCSFGRWGGAGGAAMWAGWRRWGWRSCPRPFCGAPVPAFTHRCSSLRCWLCGPRGRPYRAYAHAPNRNGWRNPLLFALAFVLALYSQEQALLLYPSILLAMVLWLGWRRLLTPPLLVAHALALAAMGARYAIEIWGQPGYFETIQATRPYVGWVLDVAGAWQTYAPQLIAPERLPWTLAGLIALAAALVIAWRARDQRRHGLRTLSLFHQSTLFYALNLLFVMGVLFLFVGTSWRDPRYLFMVQPLWLLLGAAGIVWLVEQLPRRARTPAFVAAGAGHGADDGAAGARRCHAAGGGL